MPGFCAVLLALTCVSASAQTNRYLFRQPNASEPPPIGQTQLTIPTAPGATIALIAALNEPHGTYTRYEKIETTLRDADNDGIILYDLQRAIPTRSIWAYADLATGAASVITMPGYPRRQWQLGADKIKNMPADEYDQLQHNHFILQILWVRPGEGAWTIATADGGANDEDAKNNGQTTVTAAHFRPLANSSAPPKKIKKGDVLLLIDPFEMSFAQYVVN